MFNIIKVHPQDRVRRAGSFQQFNVESPDKTAAAVERGALPRPNAATAAIGPAPELHFPAMQQPIQQQQQPFQHPQYNGPPQLDTQRQSAPPLAINMPMQPLVQLPPMEPRLNQMQMLRPVYYQPVSHNHLSPLPAMLPPLQTQFSPAQSQMHASAGYPSPMYSSTPPVSPVYGLESPQDQLQSPRPNTPISPQPAP